MEFFLTSMITNQFFIKNKTINLEMHPNVIDVATPHTRLTNVLHINILMGKYYQN